MIPPRSSSRRMLHHQKHKCFYGCCSRGRSNVNTTSSVKRWLTYRIARCAAQGKRRTITSFFMPNCLAIWSQLGLQNSSSLKCSDWHSIPKIRVIPDDPLCAAGSYGREETRLSSARSKLISDSS